MPRFLSVRAWPIIKFIVRVCLFALKCDVCMHGHRGNFRREYSLHICSLHNQATTKLGWSTNTVTSVLNIILLPACLWQSTVYLVHYSSFTHSVYYTPRGELKDSHKQSSLHVGIGIIQPPNYAMKFEDWAWRIVWLYDKTIITMWQTISEKKSYMFVTWAEHL